MLKDCWQTYYLFRFVQSVLWLGVLWFMWSFFAKQFVTMDTVSLTSNISGRQSSVIQLVILAFFLHIWNLISQSKPSWNPFSMGWGLTHGSQKSWHSILFPYFSWTYTVKCSTCEMTRIKIGSHVRGENSLVDSNVHFYFHPYMAICLNWSHIWSHRTVLFSGPFGPVGLNVTFMPTGN